MSLTYTTFVNSIANLLVVNATSDANFQTVLPNIIDDAEQRLYRELQLLNTEIRDNTAAFNVNTRAFTLPTTVSTFFVVHSVYAITPFGQTNPDFGTRNPLLPASRDYLDYTFPSSTASGVPQYFSLTTQDTMIVGPWPDQAYQAEVVGTQRPTPLSTTNVTTLLSVYFPDLMIAASMVFGAAFQQNFGASSDNPQMPGTWEAHLQELLKSASTEEAMKKFTGPGWSSRLPSPIATPART